MASVAAYDRTCVSHIKYSNLSDSCSGEIKDGGITMNDSTQPKLIDTTEQARKAGEQPMIRETTSLNQARRETGRFDGYALQIVRMLNIEGVAIGTRLLIRSKAIQKALRAVVASYGYLNLEADPIIIPKPFAPLFHYRQDILRYAKEAEMMPDERERLETLTLEFFPLYLDPVEKQYNNDRLCGRIRFELLWTLFRAGDDIVVETDHYREVRRVLDCEYKREFKRESNDDSREEEYFEISTWRWGYNAGKFGPCTQMERIVQFSATRSIDQLHCFPVNTLDTKDRRDLFDTLIARGHRWKNLIHPVHKFYSGPVWIKDRDCPKAKRIEDLSIQSAEGRVILDYKMHVEECSRLADSLTGSRGYKIKSQEETRDVHYRVALEETEYSSRNLYGEKTSFNKAKCFEDDNDYAMSDEEALLCPAFTRGFSLTDKTWACFLVDQIRDIQYNKQSFAKVKLDPNIKTAIESLVWTHSDVSTRFDDHVSGKGRGLVISLEGPPGSGKTMTPEAIAEDKECPLYTLSTAELGMSPDMAENTLKRVFRRASRWDAIVLLDEAEFFMTKRTTSEVVRHGFVNVFLRLLEYYQGIMFLTTNMMDDFDPAFDSRIHLRVPFDSPNRDTREIIWTNFLSSRWGLEPWYLEAIKRLAELDLNGREIKNLVHISIANAAYRKEALTEDTVLKMYKVSYEWRKKK